MNNQQQFTELKQIGHYDILRCIGRGGMGLVYLARDTRLNRQVAIKCLRSELCEPHYRERFKREALLLAKLNHPHIVQIYDFIETADELALVMEFVDGQNLYLHLREHIVPFSQRMLWLTQIAQGLAVAHDAGIIHRDLKAENILINKRNEAKISDLGIAKSQDFNVTLTDHVAGSYSSMSPEQAMGEELDSRSDLFSFGILAYQLLCNSHPFGETDNKLQLMQRIISHAPIPPSKHIPDLPNEISELLGQLLSKNPDNRPANTHWLAAQCEKLSQLFLASSFEPDNTQALPQSSQASIQHSQHQLQKQTRQPINTSGSGIRSKQQNLTQEHATFESIETKELPSTQQKFTAYIKTNSVTVTLGGLTLLMLAAVGIWLLQPIEPRYIAVLPPTLSTTDMQESQQELVKGAVYDAIQQSVLQLDGYYLIPQNEIADINASNTKEGLETVRRATAADELITTNIQCKIEACTITLSRLTPDDKKQEVRLRVQDTKTIDVLTDNYLSVATIVQNNVGELYSEDIRNAFKKIDESEYAKFLAVSHTYKEKGASPKLLEDLEKIQPQIKKMSSTQTLYRSISLDLHFEMKNSFFLEKFEAYINSNNDYIQDKTYYLNIYYIQMAKNNFDDALKTIDKLERMNSSSASLNELRAYHMMTTKDYHSAIKFYQKSLSSKTTSNNLVYLANAFWYAGDTVNAKEYIKRSMELSPSSYEANSLLGLIALLEGDINQAISSFKNIVSQKPNDPSNLNNLGLCYLLLTQYEKAIEFFNLSSQIAPENTTYHLNAADAKNLAGRTEESQKSYQKLVGMLTSKERINSNLRALSQAYAHLNKFTEALNTLKELEKNDPQRVETTYTAALIHTLAENNASAILNIDAALKNGMNIIWFNFSWFDRLCKNENFISIMRRNGEPNRCTLPREG